MDTRNGSGARNQEQIMSVASTISQAVRRSREYNEIVTVAAPWDEALAALRAEVEENEDSEYVENGEVMEFWAWDETTSDDFIGEVTFRVHVERHDGETC
jgi:hypothetical protein